jgi:hypothetical protein
MIVSFAFYLFVFLRLRSLFQTLLADTLQMREGVGFAPPIQERVKKSLLLVDKPLRVSFTYSHA